MKNKNLHKAKNAKKDEFYTQLTDIEKELGHYREHFKDKVVYCNCDDPRSSDFFKFFSYSFEILGLKKLISSCYINQNRDLLTTKKPEKAVWLEYNGDRNGNRIPDTEEITVRELNGNGDFRNKENIELLKQADIVVTNPPFSLFREYVAQLMKYDKKFIILGNLNAITYKEIFKLIKENKMWLGFRNGVKEFKVPEHYKLTTNSSRIDENGQKYITTPNTCWFTNLEIQKYKEDLILFRKYKPEKYPKYDNYDAINVDKVCDIPIDYTGYMGVPISFMDKYNPDQFEIIGICNSARWINFKCLTIINGKKLYNRIIIKNKNPMEAIYEH